jgi:serine/threonine-protein kinase
VSSAPRKKIKDALWRVKSPFKLVQATDHKLVAALLPQDMAGESREPKATTIPLIAPALNAARDSATDCEPTPKPIRVSQELLGGFNLIEKLGEGGMGTVFRARDRVLNREMAIKVMRADLVGDRAAVKRFQKEAAAAGDLTHPNIAQVYKCSVDEAAPYMVMEYVDGISLAQILKHERRLSLKRVINIALQICDALQYAHDKGVVHRDLKPSNIIVVDGCHSDVIKVVDFGIAKLAPANETATGLTQSGEVFGSPEYMSPEQAKGIQVDQRSDLYSLGCILFEALTGRKLFSGDNAIQILLHHINTPITDRLELLRTKRFPEPLIAVVAKLLSKQPEKRYQSAMELAVDLQRFQSGTLSSWRMRNRKKTVVAAASAFLVAVVTLILCPLLFSSDRWMKEGSVSLDRTVPVPESFPTETRAWTVPPPTDGTAQAWFEWLKDCDYTLDEPDAKGSSELRDARLYAQVKLDKMVNPSKVVPPEIMDTLIANICDDSPSASEVACSTLVTLGDNSVVPLTNYLEKHPDEKVCQDLLWSIGPPTIDYLFKRVSGDQPHENDFASLLVYDMYISDRFRDRLVSHRTTVDKAWYDATESMVLYAQNNLNQYQRIQLLFYLANRDVAQEQTITSILDIMRDDDDPVLRGDAAYCVARLAHTQSVSVQTEIFDSIVTASVNDDNSDARNDCVNAIGLFTPDSLKVRVHNALRKAARDPSPMVRRHARQIMRSFTADGVRYLGSATLVPPPPRAQL